MTPRRAATNVMRSPARLRRGWERLYHVALRGMGYGSAPLGLDASGDLFGLRLAESFLRRGTNDGAELTVVDVGANTGQFAGAAMEVFGSSVRVWCFEPTPPAFNALQSSMKDEPRVVPVRAAVGRVSGRAALYTHGDSRLSSLLPDSFEVGSMKPEGEIETEVVQLDAYLSGEGITHVNYLKIDVEGAEYDVLAGAEQLIGSDSIDFIQFEFGARTIAARRYLQDFFSLLAPSFLIHRLTGNSAVPLDGYDPRYEVFFSETNYLAVRRKLIA
jgi:FkbM family methyltransferase